MTTVQQSYSINPDIGYPGQIAEPNSPTRVEAGTLFVPSAGDPPRPGYAVYFDTANDGWRLPNNAATTLRASGILTYRADVVASATSFVEFSDGEEVFVVTMGVVWLTAGGATERHQQIEWDRTDFKWNTVTRVSAIANMLTNPVESYNRQSVVDDGIFKAAIGYGRVI